MKPETDQQKLEKYFNYLNAIYYDLFHLQLLDRITGDEWEKTKQNIWELKNTLKHGYEQENTTNK